MNCGEFERVLPEFLEGEHTREQQAHFDSCSACANLRADLDFISSQAKLLVASEEPRPAVWDALEARLRRLPGPGPAEVLAEHRPRAGRADFAARQRHH